MKPPFFSHIKRGGNGCPSDEKNVSSTPGTTEQVRQGHVIAASDNTAARETQEEKGRAAREVEKTAMNQNTSPES